MVKLLFVCSGDTCRSPMAKEILNSKVKSKKIKNLKAYSGGIFVDKFETKLSSGSRYALKMMGIKNVRHTATQITQDYLDGFNLILTMTSAHKQKLLSVFPFAKNVYSLKEYTSGVDVFDPYGKPNEVYYEVARYLDHACDQILENLYREGVLKW